MRSAAVAMLGVGLLCAAAGEARAAPPGQGGVEAGTFAAALTGRRALLVPTTHKGRLVARFVAGAGGADQLVYDIGLSRGTQVTYVTLQCAPAGSFGPVVAVLTEDKGWVAERNQLRLPDRDLAYFPEGAKHFDDYVDAVGWAQDYARANRAEMMELVVDALGDWVTDPSMLKKILVDNPAKFYRF